MYIIWFDCCGLAVSVLIMVSFYTRNRIPIMQDKVFSYQVWIAAITTTLNLVMGIWQNGGYAVISGGHLFTMETMAFFYHMFRMLNAYFYVWYILVVLDIREKSWWQALYFKVPVVVALFICAIGPYRKLVFYIDANGIHHPGPLMAVLYLIAIYYMFLIIGLNIYYRKAIPLERRIAFHSFGTLVMGTVVIERMFPTVMIEGFGSILCQLLIYLTLQKPEEIVDGSTGLLNKTSFLRMISVKFRKKIPFDAIVIEIENFRFLENTLGLLIMGKTMREVASYLRRVSPKFKVYRLSDSTLCLMSHQRDRDGSQNLLEQLKLRAAQPWQVGGQNILLPAVITRLQYPEDVSSLEQVLDLLDAKLPHLPDGVGLEEISLAIQRKRDVVRAVKDAIEKQSFEVVYQPIYSACHQKFISAEALVRLQDEKLGAVSPAEFIPIAEESDMIIKIDQFVLDTVCKFIADHRLSELGIQYIEVNLSIVECLQENLTDHILKTMGKYGINAEQINLEITETASEDLPGIVLQNINRLAEEGVRFSLDDYGMGYSNLGRLLTMPLNMIKLDKSIIQKFFSQQEPEAGIVLQETLQMLRKLHKQVVAEGVETKEQADMLIQMGCEFLQGFYYARPMSGDEFLNKITMT